MAGVSTPQARVHLVASGVHTSPLDRNCMPTSSSVHAHVHVQAQCTSCINSGPLVVSLSSFVGDEISRHEQTSIALPQASAQ